VVLPIDRMGPVRSFVGSVDLGRSVAPQQSGQRVVDEFSIGGSSVETASVIEERAIDGRTDSSARHATIMP